VSRTPHIPRSFGDRLGPDWTPPTRAELADLLARHGFRRQRYGRHDAVDLLANVLADIAKDVRDPLASGSSWNRDALTRAYQSDAKNLTRAAKLLDGVAEAWRANRDGRESGAALPVFGGTATLNLEHQLPAAEPIQQAAQLAAVEAERAKDRLAAIRNIGPASTASRLLALDNTVAKIMGLCRLTGDGPQTQYGRIKFCAACWELVRLPGDSHNRSESQWRDALGRDGWKPARSRAKAPTKRRRD
jgi:hypothetical protein